MSLLEIFTLCSRSHTHTHIQEKTSIDNLWSNPRVANQLDNRVANRLHFDPTKMFQWIFYIIVDLLKFEFYTFSLTGAKYARCIIMTLELLIFLIFVIFLKSINLEQ